MNSPYLLGDSSLTEELLLLVKQDENTGETMAEQNLELEVVLDTENNLMVILRFSTPKSC